MTEVSKAVAIPAASLICQNLMDEYGEPSHHDGVTRQARFEVNDIDGRECSLLITQKGIGSAAIYNVRVHETLNGKHESIYTMQNGTGVLESLKISGEDTYGPYQWPASTGSNLLHDCYGKQRF